MILPDNASIIVLASNYNPSIVSKDWLYKNKVFTGKVSNFVHTPVLSLIENEDFSFIVDEQRLQVMVKKVIPENFELAGEIIGRFTNILPETPYKGLGINYQYSLPEEKNNLGVIFTTNNDKANDIFASQYKLGTVVIFFFEGFMVNFSASPSLTDDKIRLKFNFHSDLSGADQIKEKLALQNATLEKAESIVKGVSK
jgi:hypothetical protein